MFDLNPVFIPGPTNIPDRLRRAMMVQTQDHRAPDFVETFAPVLENTKKVFGTTTGEVITFPASGTGGWEAGICNTLSKGDKVLIATGELNTSERLVLPVQQVPLKVAKAADTIAAWQSNIDISFLVPTQNLHELNIQTSNIAILGVNTLEQAMATFPAQAATSSSHNSSPKATPNTQVVQVATAKTIRVTHWLIIFMLALLVGVAAFSFDFSLQTQSAALQQVKPNPIKQTTQRPNSLANSQATKVNYPLGLTANFSYANQNNCSQINKSAISQFLTVQNPVSQPHQNLCKISIVAAEQVASLMAVNLQSHLFVLGKKVKEHWAIPVPKRPAKVIVITFSLALSEDDVSQIRQYLFNYPDNQTLDIQGFIDSIQSNNKHLKNNILSHYSLQLTGS